MLPLRTWLAKSPHPHKLLVTNDDGDEKNVLIGATRSRWRDAEDACKHAVSIDALDANGDVLRTWRAPQAASVSEAVNVSGGTSSVMLVEVARVVMEAGDRGASRHADAYRIAFDQQLALVKLIADRLNSLESAWHEMIVERAREAEENAAAAASGGGDSTLEMLAAAVAPMLAAGAAPQPPPNGGKK